MTYATCSSLAQVSPQLQLLSLDRRMNFPILCMIVTNSLLSDTPTAPAYPCISSKIKTFSCICLKFTLRYQLCCVVNCTVRARQERVGGQQLPVSFSELLFLGPSHNRLVWHQDRTWAGTQVLMLNSTSDQVCSFPQGSMSVISLSISWNNNNAWLIELL